MQPSFRKYFQNIMPQQLNRKAAARILKRKENWGEKSRLAKRIGVRLCSLSNWLRGRGGLSVDKAAVILWRAYELEYGPTDSLAEQQQQNQRAKGSSLTQNLP